MKKLLAANTTVTFLVTGFVFSSLCATSARATPRELQGKSIIVTFTENRVQRQTGWSNFRPVSISGELEVYVGTNGHVFSRVKLTNRRQNSGSKDSVGNSGGNFSFAGTRMVGLQAAGDGARRFIVNFEGSYSSCTADVVRAKQVGTHTIRAKSIILPGVEVEIQSVNVTGVGCSVREGNIFGAS